MVTDKFLASDLDYIRGRRPEAAEKVQAALNTNKSVVWERSSFSDPGPDWNRVVVNPDSPDREVVYNESGY